MGRATPALAAFLVLLPLAAHAASAPKRPAAATPTPRPVTATPAHVDTTRPSFTGRWRLDMERSTFGGAPGTPKARTDVIDHRADAIRQVLYLQLPTGPDTTAYRYTLDGKPSHNRVGSQDITATVAWESDVLHILSKTRLMMIEMSLDERWRLAAGGDSLVMSRTVKYPLGEARQTLRFGRE